jgi:hypothetical protein
MKISTRSSVSPRLWLNHGAKISKSRIVTLNAQAGTALACRVGFITLLFHISLLLVGGDGRGVGEGASLPTLTRLVLHCLQPFRLLEWTCLVIIVSLEDGLGAEYETISDLDELEARCSVLPGFM